MRGTLKSDTYFQGLIQEIREVIHDAEIRIQRPGIPDDRRFDLKAFIFTERLHLCIASYSAGLDSVEVRSLWAGVVPGAQQAWEYPNGANKSPYYFDGYVKLVWLLSLGILLDVDHADLAPLKMVVANASGKDWLLEFLISSGEYRANENTCLFPNPYDTLRQVVINEENNRIRATLIKKYLTQQWYPGHQSCYWYDNHKGRHDTYFGYWSFETAAVVKILGIDDSSFRDSPYYPKALV